MNIGQPRTASFPAAWAVNTGGSTGTGPRVFLNYMTFDKNYVPVTDVSQTNYVRISTAAKETGTDIPHQKLTATVTVKQAGYMYIYFSNEESTTNYEAFFDDFTVTHSKSPVLQAEDYYPFGLVATGYRRENSTGQSYLYQGKEIQEDLALNIYDFEARGYDPILGRTWQQDPHSQNYYDWSLYSWSGNNPVIMIDPDGRDFLIWYENEDGKQVNFRFNGTNSGDAPKNEFVQNFLTAYNYNVENGGGEMLQSIASNSDLKIGVAITEEGSQHYAGNIYWNPNAGAEYENGTVVSPATVLEHEADHANQRATNYDQYSKDRDTRDPQYRNKEEKRVITGSEQRTARGNKEVSPNGVTRTAHVGNSVITGGPTSNKVNREATYNYYLKLKQQGYDVDKQLIKYKPR
jgi:RHS repeat-associated protein